MIAECTSFGEGKDEEREVGVEEQEVPRNTIECQAKTAGQADVAFT